MNVFDGLPDIFVDVFGDDIPITYNGVGIKGIWVDPSVTLSIEASVGFVATQPELHVQASDFPTVQPKEGDSVVRGGIAYRVDGPPRPDGKGMIVLTMGKA